MVHLDNILWHSHVEHLIIHPEYSFFHMEMVLAGNGGEDSRGEGEEETDKYLSMNRHLPIGDKVTAGPII
jgi:hypothetical protein